MCKAKGIDKVFRVALSKSKQEIRVYIEGHKAIAITEHGVVQSYLAFFHGEEQLRKPR